MKSPGVRRGFFIRLDDAPTSILLANKGHSACLSLTRSHGADES
jgi:hypothetical protein